MVADALIEDCQAMVPFQILAMVGHCVRTVCPGNEPGETVKTAVHELEGDRTYTQKPGHRFAINTCFGTKDFTAASAEGNLVGAAAWPGVRSGCECSSRHRARKSSREQARAVAASSSKPSGDRTCA